MSDVLEGAYQLPCVLFGRVLLSLSYAELKASDF